jgi:hypothetical protein
LGGEGVEVWQGIEGVEAIDAGVDVGGILGQLVGKGGGKGGLGGIIGGWDDLGQGASLVPEWLEAVVGDLGKAVAQDIRGCLRGAGCIPADGKAQGNGVLKCTDANGLGGMGSKGTPGRDGGCMVGITEGPGKVAADGEAKAADGGDIDGVKPGGSVRGEVVAQSDGGQRCGGIGGGRRSG